MTEDDDKYRPPEDTIGDDAHALVKAVLGSVPVIGAGLAAEVFDKYVRPPVQKKEQEWREAVATGLHALEQRVQGFDLENLKENEQFASAVAFATRRALESTNTEKRAALLNALLNVAQDCPIPESEREIFFHCIDKYTAWHLRILELFSGPQQFADKNGIRFPEISMGGLSSILTAAFPELADHEHFYRQVVADLNNDGFLSVGELNVTMSGTGLLQKRTTQYGDRFLDFIKVPMGL